MTMHRFELFASIAKHGNVTKAARELNISQSSISHQLKLLRNEFQKSTLYKKSGRGIILTDQGRDFRKDVESILCQVAELKKKYGAKLREQKNEHLTVGGSHGPAISVLPSLIAIFKKTHPSAQIELTVRNSPDIQNLVLNSQVELAVITNPSPSPLLVSEPFRDLELCVFVARHHPLARAKEIKADTLARFPLIIGPRKAGTRTDELLSCLTAKGLKLNVVMRCEWPEAVKVVVAKGEGVGILYRDIVEAAANNGLFKIINVRGLNLKVLSYIVYSKEKSLYRTAEEFLALLRARAKDPFVSKTHKAIIRSRPESKAQMMRNVHSPVHS